MNNFIIKKWHQFIYLLYLILSLANYNWVNGKKLLMGSANLNLASFNTRDNLVAIKDRFEKGVRFYTNISDLGK